jgi:hypothetical protein
MIPFILACTLAATPPSPKEPTMITGTLHFVDLETGFWQLTTPQGKYVLRFAKHPSDLKNLEGKTVGIEGKIRSDLMTSTMAGKVLEVESIIPK